MLMGLNPMSYLRDFITKWGLLPGALGSLVLYFRHWLSIPRGEVAAFDGASGRAEPRDTTNFGNFGTVGC